MRFSHRVMSLGLAIVVALLSPLLSSLTTVHAQGEITHLVQPGDTLGEIAALYGVTVEAIAVANGLANPDVILLGQQLVVPNVPGRRILELPEPLTELRIPARAVLQGETWTIGIRSSAPITPTGTFDGRVLHWVAEATATGDEQRYWALAGVHALAEPGVKPLLLQGQTMDGKEWALDVDITVHAGVFETYAIILSRETSKLLDPDLVRTEAARLAAIWPVTHATPLWQGAFEVPVRPIWPESSAYGQRRSYNGGPPSSYHEGVDFGASQGALVLAPAPGRVVLAEPLTVRGNAVILDHGAGVHTGYWHLWQILIAEGQIVERGAPLGRVGSTGLSTGPHLHWELRVGDVAVDPLQWTRQSIPDIDGGSGK
jgi:murein DD-endopeptidase MepM/ murein hydrolase activator NlpD